MGTVYRYVPHTITQAPGAGVVAEIFCTVRPCRESSGPQSDPESALAWALRHAGRTAHDVFRREFTDHARVTRAE